MNAAPASADESRADLRTRRALRSSVVEGMCHAMMLGCSESYLGAFAVELGHGALALALLSTVPLLVGALMQLLAAPLVHLVGGRKRLVVIGAALQAAAQLGFIAIASAEDRRLSSLLVVKSLFWASGSLIAPAWGSWMAGLTTQVRRERYFAVRSGMVELALLVAFACGGWWLHDADPSEVRLRFAGMFAVAMLARASSAVLLAWQYDPGTAPPSGEPSFARVVDAARRSRWRVALYLGAMMFGANVAIPYFTPHMLRNLGFSFGEFALLLAISIAAKAIAFPLCHRLALKVGLRRVLLYSGIGVALLPLWWVWARTVPSLVGAQLLGGATWAGLEYASFQLLLQSAPEHRRLEFLSLSSSLTGAMQLAGALTGSWLLSSAITDYEGLFAISTVLRGIALAVLVVAVRPLVFAAALPRLFTRLSSVRPNAGAVRGAVLDEPASEPPPGDERA
jgi:MFS family permease